MIPCISQACTLSTPFEADLPAFANAGWSAVELWLTKLETYLETHTLDDVKQLLAENGLSAPGASWQGGLLNSRGDAREAHWTHYQRRLELLQSLEVGTLIVAVDFSQTPSSEDIGLATSSLVRASELAGAHGVRIALEFQKSARFCASLDTTLALIAQSEAEHVGVCLDLFHFYTGPSKFEDLAYLSPENLAWVQVSDLSGVPRELAGDSDRIMPGDGDFSIGPILDHLRAMGYTGALSLEVLNPMFWSIPAGTLADAAIRAMARLVQASESNTQPEGS